jgi:hypothetical protein
MIPFTATLGRHLLPLALLVLIAKPSFAADYRCDIPNVRIVGGDPKSALLVCEGAKTAVDFLSAQGLDVSHTINIRVVKQLANKAAAGHLEFLSDSALLLSYSEFLKFGKWLRVPIDIEIYRALAAHEVAHVIAVHNFQIPKPTVQAHEYIAYVTTFATLDVARREQVLEKFSGDGFETEQQMNTTIYLCDPFWFGAEAYRHFLKQGKNANYFRSILSGNVLTE